MPIPKRKHSTVRRARTAVHRAAPRTTKAAKRAGAVKAPAKRWPTGLVTLKVVAKRADADPKFFKAMTADPNAINAVLERYHMRLSEVDAGRLMEALERARELGVDILKFVAAFDSWGPWPDWNVVESAEPPVPPGAEAAGRFKGNLGSA